jgi:hypothetical protein
MADDPLRRRFQFRLRTLMLFLTLGCVIASWIGWRLYIARLDDEVRVFGAEWPPPRDLLRPQKSTSGSEEEFRLRAENARLLRSRIWAGAQASTHP